MSVVFYQLIDQLPTSGMTVMALRALDFVAPGQWENVTGFQNMIQSVTGETDPDYILRIHQRAMELFNDPNEGYQRALWIYQTVDRADDAMANMELAHAAGDRVAFLGFLSKLTPDPDKLQGIDLAVKIVAELSAFCYTNGLPGDSIADFVAALSAYEKESMIRMAALVCFDGLIPLGPDFVQIVQEKISSISGGELEQNQMFSSIKALIPGGDTFGQQNFIAQSFGNVSGWIQNFVGERGLSPQSVLQSLTNNIAGLDDKADVVAALLDKTTYFSHTGAQSIARSLIERAVNEI
jgi:hypothetical protein